MTARHATLTTLLGEVTFVADGDVLTGVYLDGQAYAPAGFGEAAEAAADPLLAEAARQFGDYLGGDRRSFDLPLQTAGSEVEQAVREAMLAVPFGETTTYGAIAADLGETNLAQAVGRTVGHNPFIVVVPCHRVLGADGRLTGYAGGLDRKAYLLDHEQYATGATVLPPTAPAQWQAQVVALSERAAEPDTEAS